jgi:hypothetical protein
MTLWPVPHRWISAGPRRQGEGITTSPHSTMSPVQSFAFRPYPVEEHTALRNLRQGALRIVHRVISGVAKKRELHSGSRHLGRLHHRHLDAVVERAARRHFISAGRRSGGHGPRNGAHESAPAQSRRTPVNIRTNTL